MNRTFLLVILAALLVWISIDPAGAQEAQEPILSNNNGGSAEGGDILEASLKSLTILLVVAVLLESALSVLFNWRVFLAYFSVSGLKTVINFGVSFLVVTSFNLDVVATLFDEYTTGNGPETNTGTQVLTALILAGGSSGVNKLLAAFGYRSGSDTEVERPKPPKDKAWISVRVRRAQARSAVQVHVTEDPRPPSGLTAIAGTCLGARPSLGSLLMRNNDRFPQNGGYSVQPDTAYRISVSAAGPDGDVIRKDVTSEPIKLAAGAIVDFDVVL